MILNKIFLLAMLFSGYTIVVGQNLIIARLKYSGGGDWYNDPDAIPNLAKEMNKRTNLKTEEYEKVVSLNDEKLFNYPFLFMTGHGNVTFSDDEVRRLRTYLILGGFLYADDDYGMDESFRREIKKVFPENELVELPYEHPIYHLIYKFPSGLPKIHEHYEGAPKGYGIFYQGRLVVFYTWNSNISDGWTEAHDDPIEKREEAFKMGINIIAYALTH
ncbi:MAG: DUF4159 domain-containing protein [candidate division WOR-3 bacterium]|nr:DUF4159 domain-containing protein [candidate division WOR-3 bacterium]